MSSSFASSPLGSVAVQTCGGTPGAPVPGHRNRSLLRVSDQIGRIPQHAAIELGRKLMREHPDADTILLPSPHWPTAGAIEPLEREFGVNVMTAQQAIVWDALRRCGVTDKIEGFGRLFREF